MAFQLARSVLLVYLAAHSAALAPAGAVQHRGMRQASALAATGLSERDDVQRARAVLLGTGGARKKPHQDWDIELCSPSKINLFLRIVRRRDDGYALSSV